MSQIIYQTVSSLTLFTDRALTGPCDQEIYQRALCGQNFRPISQPELGSDMSALVFKTKCFDLFYVTITEYQRLEHLLKTGLSQQDGSARKGLFLLSLSSIPGIHMMEGGKN